jgi:ribonuclease Z
MAHSNLFAIWNFHKELERTGFTLKGHSRGGERSGFIIPAISLMFDAGVRTHQTPKQILITHCHCDHSFELPVIMTGEWKTLTNIYTPVDPQIIINFIHSSFTMMNNGLRKSPPFRVHQIKAGDSFRFEEGKKNYQIDVFKCYHTVDTVGYGVSEIRMKLKDEYKGLSGPDIVQLKKSGTDICQEEINKHIIYLCDTTIEVFTDVNIFNYKFIMIECTIFDEESKKSAYKNGHIYWGDLLPIVKAHPDNEFILFHFSTRYTDEAITSFFSEEAKKEGFSNVFPWIN